MQYILDKANIKTEILSGLTISVALVPEAISFALLIGAAPQVGLWAAVFMALSTSFFGGRPGLISGATGATAVILGALVKAHGMEYLFTGVLLAGLMQLLIWRANLWKLFEKIPKTVMSGFLIALAIMIFTSQLSYLNLGRPPLTMFMLNIGVILAAAAAMWISIKKFKFPPAISAITVGIIIGIPLGLPTVDNLSPVSANLPSFAFPLLTLKAIVTVLPYAFGVAISGLTESLIAVGDKGSKKRETFAQGVGNTISSFFGAMGGCVLIGQTNLNLNAGAKHRLSSFMAAAGLTLIIVLFGEWIGQIPLAGLIGVMLIVVVQTGDWTALRTSSTQQAIIISSTVLLSLFTHNLALGVIIGTFLYYLLIKKDEKVIR